MYDALPEKKRIKRIKRYVGRKKKYNSDSFWGKLKKEEREREKMGRTDGCSGESWRFYCAGGLHVS